MHSITYFTDKVHVDRLKEAGQEGYEYIESFEKTANTIVTEWEVLDYPLDNRENLFYYYQNPNNHCVARIGRRGKEPETPIFLIQFSFVKKEVLEQMLRDFNLPFEKFNIRQRRHLVKKS